MTDPRDPVPADPLAIEAAPSASPAPLREALYELFDSEDFMAAHLNARSLTDAVLADPAFRAALTTAETPEIEPHGATVFRVVGFARHRTWCPEYTGPGDCTCGLDALLDSIRCTCGHGVSRHTDRDVSDVVGWPCIDCASARCPGFALAESES